MTYLRPCPKPERRKKEKVVRPRKVAIEENPLEEIEQQTVAEWLDAHKVFYCASLAGSYLHPATYNRVKRIGYKKGFPDLMIYQKPPAYNGKFVGVAIEMKRRKNSVVSEDQKYWLQRLQEEGWLAVAALGADQAIEILEGCGFGGKK